LCRDNPLLSFFLDKLPNKLFACSVRVDIGRVNKVTACLSVRIKDPSTLLCICSPTPIFTKRHGSKANLRHTQPTFPKKLVFHRPLHKKFRHFSFYTEPSRRISFTRSQHF